MAYATVYHVAAMNQGRISATVGQATPGQVVDFLEQTAGVLDGLLGQHGYSVPVSPTAATSARRTLENFNAIGAWYHVELSAKSRDKVQFEAAKTMWESAQKMLSDGVVELDLAIDIEESLPRGGFGAHSSAATPFFSRDMEL